jgi:hypothetical protein
MPAVVSPPTDVACTSRRLARVRSPTSRAPAEGWHAAVIVAVRVRVTLHFGFTVRVRVTFPVTLLACRYSAGRAWLR